MSTIDAAYSLPQPGALPVRELRAEPGPWGFWGSLGWGAFAIATGFFATVVLTVIWMAAHGFRIANPEGVAYATSSAIVVLTAPLIVLALAAKIRKFSLRDYFSVNGFAHSDLALGIGCLMALIVAFIALQALLGIDGGSREVGASYRAAKAAGMLPLLLLHVLVVAPLTEELFFRGFLHRGWAPSWLGVSGTIVVTSALWAVLHQQYNVLGILLIFAMGLIFGWMRQRSNSTLLPMVLHAINNLLATGFVAIQVEWLS
jgi:membrane protease YdiL (CAAX protease family)